MADDPQPVSQNVSNKTYNYTLGILVLFIVLYSVGIFFYIEKKTEDSNIKMMPIAMIDPASGVIKFPPSVSNFFNYQGTPNAKVMSPKQEAITAVPQNKSYYEQKSAYQINDFVIVNYFFIEGIVVEKSGNDYTVLYKNHDKTLSKITLPKEFLLSPKSGVGVSPFSLIAD